MPLWPMESSFTHLELVGWGFWCFSLVLLGFMAFMGSIRQTFTNCVLTIIYGHVRLCFQSCAKNDRYTDFP